QRLPESCGRWPRPLAHSATRDAPSRRRLTCRGSSRPPEQGRSLVIGCAGAIPSNSWRTTPKAKSRSSSEPRAPRTRRPLRRAAALAASRIAVLPRPTPPSTTRSRPRPTPERTAASSDSRSRSFLTPAPRAANAENDAAPGPSYPAFRWRRITRRPLESGGLHPPPEKQHWHEDDRAEHRNTWLRTVSHCTEESPRRVPSCHCAEPTQLIAHPGHTLSSEERPASTCRDFARISSCPRHESNVRPPA